MSRSPLPVDDIYPSLQLALAEQPRVILQAQPGAGKSTRLPLLLVESGANGSGAFSANNQIIILEPRRVAARQIARYLASQLNEPLGKRIGLAMRGENVTSKETILTVVTDGVLVKMLQADPELSQVGLIIFDEFHERSLQSDLALALSLDCQALNERLALMIMSATLDSDRLAQQLDAPVVTASGRQFPIDVKYLKSNLIPTVSDVYSAINHALKNDSGSILVFLPGVYEIQSLMALLKDNIDSDCDVFPLYGGLTIDAQTKAIMPAPNNKRKIVLATNIAQTSLTIEGIDVVIDSGLEKINIYQPKLNSDSLVTQFISKAAAEQRAGRAGRLAPGVCYRLGNKEHWQRRADFDVAEIERSDLAQLLLEVSVWGASFDDLYWTSRPESSQLAAATTKLNALGYVAQVNVAANKLVTTALCERYQNSGLGLRATKIIDYVAKRNESDKGAGIWIAAWLDMGLSDSQIKLAENLSNLAHYSNKVPSKVQQAIERLARYLNVNSKALDRGQFDEQWLASLIALAYPDRIAKRQSKRWKMSNGGAVEFHSNSQPSRADFIVVVDFSASKHGQYVRHYIELDAECFERDLADLVVTRERVVWSTEKLAPVAFKEQVVGELILKQQAIKVDLTESQWVDVWLDYVKQHGLFSFGKQADTIRLWLAKMALMNQHYKDWPFITEQQLWLSLSDWLAPYLDNVRSVKQLQSLPVLDMLNGQLEWAEQQTLAENCPKHYLTPAGTQVKIDYQTSPPKVSVRLQEMFGEPTSPSICGGRQPLLIELLSPAMRPLQVTQDLAHFWQNAYQEVKKEMKGRYPKHRWPDSPELEKAGHSLKKKMPMK